MSNNQVNVIDEFQEELKQAFETSDGDISAFVQEHGARATEIVEKVLIPMIQAGKMSYAESRARYG